MNKLFQSYKDAGIDEIKVWVTKRRPGQFAVNGHVLFDTGFEYTSSTWISAPTEEIAIQQFQQQFNIDVHYFAVLQWKKKNIDNTRFFEACGFVKEEQDHLNELAKNDSIVQRLIEQSAYQYFIH